MNVRVIPCLLLSGAGLVKTVEFSQPMYVGDPLNTVRILNDFEADELFLLSIDGQPPNISLLNDVAAECSMPLCYGGAISSLAQIQQVLSVGAEKVALNTALVTQPNLLSEAAARYGSQALVASIDVRQDSVNRYSCYIMQGRQRIEQGLDEMLDQVQKAGAGEVLLTSINREGRRCGYDLELVERAARRLSVPLTVLGGAHSLEDLRQAALAGASGLAAGSLFVLEGRLRSVLVSYPEKAWVRQLRA
jgi:imidazole glycerol-phosphate synthase subunit HisF